MLFNFDLSTVYAKRDANNWPQGAYIPLIYRLYTQSVDRCVLGQRTGASVFFERIRKQSRSPSLRSLGKETEALG